jgi:putative hydrolase of HD superfamily
MVDERLHAQLQFVKLADRLKCVTRRNYLASSERLENSAEHSWHIALMANILAGYSNAKADVAKVTLMLLVHDLVEIEAGDTYAYDSEGQGERKLKERQAADAVFGKLPKDQRDICFQLWNEFEESQTNEARFAQALDHFLPVLQNFLSDGKSWIENGITREQVLEYNVCIREGSETLWELVIEMVDKAGVLGYFKQKSESV